MNNMIKVVMIMAAVKNIISLFVNQLITIHLGKNPMKGGSPPKDKKFSSNENLICLVLFMMLFN